jgi:hypothetical protein
LLDSSRHYNRSHSPWITWPYRVLNYSGFKPFHRLGYPNPNHHRVAHPHRLELCQARFGVSPPPCGRCIALTGF